MENNEIMFENVEAMDGVIQNNGSSRIGNGVAMLVGAGLAIALGASFKFGKKAVAVIKAKRAERMSGDADLRDYADNE